MSRVEKKTKKEYDGRRSKYTTRREKKIHYSGLTYCNELLHEIYRAKISLGRYIFKAFFLSNLLRCVQ